MVTLDGSDVGPIGFGLMGLTWTSTPLNTDDAVAIMKHAVTKGTRFFNGGEFYGPPEHNSVHLIRKYFTTYPEDKGKVRFNIKGGMDTKLMKPDVTEAGIQKSIKAIQTILGDIPLDMFEPARLDPNLDPEVTFRALKKAYDNGQVKGVGLSEVNGKTLELGYQILGKALKSVELELSLTSIDLLSEDVIKVCRKHNLTLVAYSPLGRGLLSGRFKTPEEVPDKIKQFPRFSGQNLINNLKLVHALVKLANDKGCTPAQIAIGWILAVSGKDGNPAIIPIPGATTKKRLDENLTPIRLSESDLAAINKVMKENPVSGGRYDDSHAQYLAV